MAGILRTKEARHPRVRSKEKPTDDPFRGSTRASPSSIAEAKGEALDDEQLPRIETSYPIAANSLAPPEPPTRPPSPEIIIPP